MMRAPIGTRYGKPIVGLVVSGMVVAGLAPGPAAAQVSELNGSAYGAFASLGVFGGAPTQVGAAPVVVLPPDGGSQADSLPELIVQFGPAVLLGGQTEGSDSVPTGELTVSTEGETGPEGFVTSTASVVDVGPGPFVADEVASTCTADAGGVTGSVTITGGSIATSTDVETQEPLTTEDIPENPPPNTTIEGTVDHVGDSYRAVFNEQIVDGDTITVRAVHLFLLGPLALGELIVGQTVCGLSADDGSTTPPTLEPVVDSPADESTTTTTPETGTSEPDDTDGDDTDGEEAATDDTDLSADAASSGSDDDSSALPFVALAAVVALGLAALFVVKRRGRPTAET